MTSEVADPAASDLGHPQRWWILVVLCLALTVIVIDNTILSVALPRLAHDLDASESTLQWVTTAYSLVLAGLLLPLAGIGDRYGRKRLLLIGLVVFGVSSIAAAWAGTAGHLVAARALMGVGGACSMPATLAILSNVFPPSERGRADRALVGDLRPGRRRGSGRRGPAAEPLLVGLGVPGQRARRARHRRRGRACSSRRRRIRRPGRSTSAVRRCGPARWSSSSTGSSRAPCTAGPRRSCSAPSVPAWRSWRRSRPGSAARPTHCCHRPSWPSPACRPGCSSSRRPSSPCSVSSSC